MYSTSYVGFYISITRPINKQHVYDCISMPIISLDKTTFTQTWLHVCALGLVSTIDHEVKPWKMAFFHGPTGWSNFHGLISHNINLQSL